VDKARSLPKSGAPKRGFFTLEGSGLTCKHRAENLSRNKHSNLLATLSIVGPDVIKHFTTVINEYVIERFMAVIYECKYLECLFMANLSSQSNVCKTRMERLVGDKHSNLLGAFANYRHAFFKYYDQVLNVIFQDHTWFHYCFVSFCLVHCHQ
jgi:hypothetical protein